MRISVFQNAKTNSDIRELWLLIFLTCCVLLYSLWIAVNYQFQPLLERHPFRQTQTALTTFWMLREGWKFDYETPVVGYPWSIPFEFPIYQMLVALLVKLTGWPLDAAGRLTSYGFLLACAYPAHLIARRLDLPRQTFWVFCALLWSSPIYLFWGRTFMIETAALFFALLMIPFALDLREAQVKWRSVFLCMLFGTLACMQKVTTGGPVIMVFGLFWIAHWLLLKPIRLPPMRNILATTIAFGTPILLTLLWTQHTDIVKQANAFGSQQTSQELTRWNFGFVYQRLTAPLYLEVFWHRMLESNAGGIFGAALLLGASLFPVEKRIRWLMVALLTLFVVPIMVFTNLHIVHDYYQAGCAVFLIGALAITTSLWLPRLIPWPITVPLATALLVLFNLFAFNAYYGKFLGTTPVLERSAPFVAAQIVRDHTPLDSAIVVFDDDWSSRIAYYAERKAFTVSYHFRDLDKAMADPRPYIGPLPLSAVVICPSSKIPNLEALREKYRSQASAWVEMMAGDCSVFLDKSYKTEAFLYRIPATHRLVRQT